MAHVHIHVQPLLPWSMTTLAHSCFELHLRSVALASALPVGSALRRPDVCMPPMPDQDMSELQNENAYIMQLLQTLHTCQS